VVGRQLIPLRDRYSLYRHTSCLEEIFRMVKLMLFDGEFYDDGASASSRPSWMVGVIDCVVGESKITL
jgi:hypothetical protein